MKDTKSSLLLVLSLLLLSLSLVLLCIWGYQYFNSNDFSSGYSATGSTSPSSGKPAANSPSAHYRDSLQQLYSATLVNIDNQIDTNQHARYAVDGSVPVAGSIDEKLAEINQLKSEIGIILKSRNNVADLDMAQQKIMELQMKIDELNTRNRNIEQENLRLQSMLASMSSDKKQASPTSTPTNVKLGTTVVYDNSKKNMAAVSTSDNLATNTTILATELRLTGITGADEQETTFAEDAEKLNGSFTVKNTTGSTTATEVMIVILKPDGKVLQPSAWESGFFTTKDGARRLYTRKIKFDFTKGEPRKLQFSMNADGLPKGNYTFQIYHNGQLIARSSKVFS